MKTIKQIADEIGVSKQAVYKRVKGSLHTVVAPYVHTVDGVVCVSYEGENIIIKAFSEKFTYKGTHTERIQDAHTVDDEIIKLLQDNIALLQTQLEEKDRQIDKLTDTVKAQAQSINAAQALHAGTMQDKLTEGHTETADPNASRRSKKWWQFGRK